MIQGEKPESRVEQPEAKKPTGPIPPSRCPVCCLSIILFILFLIIFSIAIRFTHVKPYATLKEADLCSFFLFSPDSSLLVTATPNRNHLLENRGLLHVWDVARGYRLFSIGVSEGRTFGKVCFSPDSNLLAACEENGDIVLWETKKGESFATVGLKKDLNNFNFFVDFRFSPDGHYIVFQDYAKGGPGKNIVTFWNLESKQEHGSVDCLLGELAFSADGKSFTTFRRKDHLKVDEIMLWKMNKTPVLLKNHHIGSDFVAFPPDLQVFASAKDLPGGKGEAVMWEMTSGKELWRKTFNQNKMRLVELMFSGNGKILLARSHWEGSFGPRQFNIWEVTSGPKEIGSSWNRPGVSPDGEWLALDLGSGPILLQGSTLNTRVLNIIGEGNPFCGYYSKEKNLSPGVSFSPNSDLLVIVSEYGKNSIQRKLFPNRNNPIPDYERLGQLWDVPSCQELLVIMNCDEARFSPNGKVMATLQRGSPGLKLWEIPFRKSLSRILGLTVLLWMALVIIFLLLHHLSRRPHKPMKQLLLRVVFGPIRS